MIRWSARAREDVREAVAYIAADNPAAAMRWADAVERRLELAEGTPRAGRVVPEFGDEGLREVLVGRFRLLYRFAPHELQVVRVWEGHRLLRAENLIDREE